MLHIRPEADLHKHGKHGGLNPPHLILALPLFVVWGYKNLKRFFFFLKNDNKNKRIKNDAAEPEIFLFHASSIKNPLPTLPTMQPDSQQFCLRVRCIMPEDANVA